MSIARSAHAAPTHLEAGGGHEKLLDALRMVQGAVADAHARTPDCQLACIVLVAAPVAVFCRLVDELVKGGEDVVCKLNLVCGDTMRGKRK